MLEEGLPILQTVSPIPSHPTPASGPRINPVPTTGWYPICSRAAIKTNGTITDCRRPKQTEQITVCFRKATTTEAGQKGVQDARGYLLASAAPRSYCAPRMLQIEKQKFAAHFRVLNSIWRGSSRWLRYNVWKLHRDGDRYPRKTNQYGVSSTGAAYLFGQKRYLCGAPQGCCNDTHPGNRQGVGG